MMCSKKIILARICLLIAILCLASVSAFSTIIEISGETHLTNNADRYDRNPSIINYGGQYWLFYTKADDGSTNGVRGPGYNPDNDSYVIWYKTASTISGLANSPETKLELSETNRPVGFDQRDVSAAILNGNLYVFASAGWGGSPQPVYYYMWNGSWSGPTSLGNGGGGHANVAYDANRIYVVEETGFEATLQSIAYTWDGTTLNGPYTIANGNGVPKITLMGGNLYVVSIAPGATIINVHSAPANANPTTWIYVSDPVTVSGAYVWDPSIFNDGTDLYVLAAPSTSVPDQQWLVQTKSTDNGSTWSALKTVSYGGYGTIYWWDFWPCGYYDGTDKYIFFTTETSSPVYSDGEIAYIKMNWDIAYDHCFYIQNGIDQSSAGDTVHVLPGTYVENIVIDKPLALLGTGEDSVLVYPAISDIGQPNPQDPPSFRGSQMVIVQAKNVLIAGLTLDGDNPTLTPEGTLDARNGIITNYTLGDWDSLKVRDCTVKNIYLRGIYAPAESSINGIQITYNKVHHVKGIPYQSAGIMIWGGDGFIDNNECANSSMGILFCAGLGSWEYVRFNKVDSCDLGIGVNENKSVAFLYNNRVTSSDQGIQTIAVNTMALLTSDTIKSCDYGLVLYGLENGGTTHIQYSSIDGMGASGSIGVYASTDVSPWGVGDVQGWLLMNKIVNNWMGIVLNEPTADTSKHVLVDIGTTSGAYNLIYDYDSSALYLENCNDNINATYNYWSKSLVSQIEEEIYHHVDDSTLGLVDFSFPFLLGDVNTNRVVELGDVVYLITYLYKEGPAPYILILGDTNRNGVVELGDLVLLISYLYRDGPPPIEFFGGTKPDMTKGKVSRPTPVYDLMK
jgi:hypothetical protein